MRSENTSQGKTMGRIQLYATPLDASYSNTYDYQLHACSQLKFRVVPVPGPGQARGHEGRAKTGKNVPLNDARDMLTRLGIPYELADPYYEPRGSEIVTKTSPEAGDILPGGQALVLTLKIG